MKVEVMVPATTANLGPGFDCLGAALNLYNRFCFQAGSSGLAIRYRGQDHVSQSQDNLVYRAFCRAFEVAGQGIPPLDLEIELQVPLSRGLGSSATAIVGGLLGANALGNLNLSSETLLHLAIAMEGHPDNVVPALKGGCQLCVSGSPWVFCPLPWHESVGIVVVVPDFKVATETARQVLPQSVSLGDAVYTAAHLGLLIQGLQQGNGDWLRAALQDRLHQPARMHLIPGFRAVQTAGIQQGAYGVVISGAGPTLLALVPQGMQAAVGASMVAAWGQMDVRATDYALSLSREGAQVRWL
ncbi:MAG: homoserine kinase [Thermostichales cyanobacterium SZTDM-1c_bins_54]